jgi:hypothetical protein
MEGNGGSKEPPSPALPLQPKKDDTKEKNWQLSSGSYQRKTATGVGASFFFFPFSFLLSFFLFFCNKKN